MCSRATGGGQGEVTRRERGSPMSRKSLARTNDQRLQQKVTGSVEATEPVACPPLAVHVIPLGAMALTLTRPPIPGWLTHAPAWFVVGPTPELHWAMLLRPQAVPHAPPAVVTEQLLQIRESSSFLKATKRFA
jgi:hypothetical protein